MPIVQAEETEVRPDNARVRSLRRAGREVLLPWFSKVAPGST
jgi:hypothetical protein